MTQSGIPQSHVDLLTKKGFAHLVTLLPDGTPQSTPVWVDYDGKHVIINTAVGRLKDKNMQRDPRVAFSVTDPENPYRYLEVRGRVVERTKAGADQHIDAMAKRYLGQDKYPFRKAGEERVIFKVQPERSSSM
jgi:PPOX class probable F420-dependent enzyme